ncbi:MAG TPA: hypothetical protein VGQ99_19105 [Tepidisphaeraceae bacterium]|jgi:hypothetical protein|nr:hypothetical protein [Tepidisphaeraceae bacterium]
MWRWVKIFLLLICAMVVVAAGFVHWRSYRVSSVGHYYGAKSWLGIYCARGRLVVAVGKEAVQTVIKRDYYERPVKKDTKDMAFEDAFHGGQRLGIGFYFGDSPKVYYFLVPLWAIWGPAIIPIFLMSWRRARRSWRRNVNLCVVCGYDLRGSGQTCPECGHAAQERNFAPKNSLLCSGNDRREKNRLGNPGHGQHRPTVL